MKIGCLALFFFIFHLSLPAQEIKKEVYSLDGDLTELIHKSHSQRTSILLPFYEWGLRLLDKKELIAKIGEIDSLATVYDDRDLGYEAQVLKAHYLLYHLYPQVEIIGQFEELIKISQNEDLLWLEIRASSMLANYYFHDLYEYELGFEYYQRTADLLLAETPEEYPLKSACIHQLALAHYYFRDYQEAALYFKESLDAYVDRTNDYYFIQSLNTLGLSYRHLAQYDSANYYFEQLNNYAIEKGNKAWKAISSINLGYSYFLNKDEKTSVKILENVLVDVLEIGDNDLTGEVFTKLSEIKFSMGENEEGRNLAFQANGFLKNSSSLGYKAKLFPLMAKAASLDMNPALASVYIDSASLANESLSESFSALKMMRAKQKVLLQKTKDEARKLQLAQQKEIWFRNGGIILLLCLLIIGIISYRKYQVRVSNEGLKKNAQTEELLREIELLRKLISEKKRRESDNDPDEFNNISLAIKEQEQKVNLMQLMESKLLTDQNWNEFVIKFEKVHPEFFDRVNEKWATLTPSEIRLLALSRLDIDNKKMALMLGVGSDAIRQVKSRLRKKIELGAEEIIDDVIVNI